jgi:GTPase SAR1 family protein
MSIKPEGTTNSKIVIKLLLLGDVSVGKSSLLVRYADHKFDNNRVTTIGI